MKDSVVALKTALAAVLCEAKAMGIDIEKVCKNAKHGLFDSGKPYRWASPLVVIPATNEINEALEIAKKSG